MAAKANRFEQEKRHAASCSRTPSLVALTVGMALYWYWTFFRRWEFSAFFLEYPNPDAVSSLGFTCVMVAMTVLALACIIKRSLAERILLNLRWTVVLASCGSLGYAVLLVASYVPSFREVLVVFAAILLALSYVVLTLAWANAVVGLRTNKALACVALSFSLGAILSLATYLPIQIMLCIIALLPLGSGVCLGMMRAVPPPEGRIGTRETLRRLPWSMIIVFGAFIIAGRLIVGVLMPENELISLVERLESIVLSASALAAVAFIIFRSERWEHFVGTFWVVLGILFLAGSMATLLFNSFYSHFGIGAITAERNCFEVILWIVLAAVIVQERLSVVFVMSLNLLALTVIPTLIGRAIVPSLVEALGWSSQENALVLVVVMTFSLVSVMLVFLNTKSLQKRFKAHEDEESLRDAACRTSAETAGLSPRETEILGYLSRGYSTKRIAELLYISQGTVLSHTKSIYQKLGVHAKQDVIDLIDERIKEAGEAL